MLLFLAAPVSAVAWMELLPPSPSAYPGYSPQGIHVLLANDGDPVVLADCSDGGTSPRLAKHARGSGIQVWQRPLGALVDPWECGMTSDSAGAIYVAAGLDWLSDNGAVRVSKYASTDGTLLWSTDPLEPAPNSARRLSGLSAGPSGDVAISTTGNGFAVAKLAGEDGTVAWETMLPGLIGPGSGPVLAHDAAGNIVALALRPIAPPFTTSTMIVAIEFDADTGAEQWRFELPDSYYRSYELPARSAIGSIAVTSGGDVVVGHTAADRMTVTKIDGSSGSELWTRSVASPTVSSTSTQAMALDAAEDLFVVGPHDLRGGGAWQIVKLRGTDGNLLWLSEVPYDGSPYFPATGPSAVAVSVEGNVVVAGRAQDPGEDLAVIEFSGTTGQPLWRRTQDGNSRMPYPPECDRANDLAIADDGTVFVAGQLGARSSTGCRQVLMRLDAATGGFGDVPVTAGRVQITDPFDAEGRKFGFRSSGAEIHAARPGTVGDPRCSAPDGGGGRLRIGSTGGAPSFVDLFLPCDRWEARGSTETPGGYVYRDLLLQDGPCSTVEVLIRPEKGQIRVACNAGNPASPFDYDLGPVPQGSVGLRLDLGATSYCTEFSSPTGTVSSDTMTVFRAGRGPRPWRCPDF